ncbi:MAG TPA: ABC transporter permease [Terracidiphilus sp.]|jgi:predicted permease
MSRFRALWRNLFHGDQLDHDLDEELHAYVELVSAEKVKAGMSQEEAYRDTRREMGGAEQVKQGVRDIRAGTLLDRLIQDIRYALRQMRKSPGFAATAILTLALGIGANTAIFTLVHAILLKNLPVVDPKALVRVGDHEDCCILNESASSREGSYSIFPYETYKYLRDHTTEFEQLAAAQAGGADLSARQAGNAMSHSSRGEFVSGNYFETFGVRPFAGRSLMPADDADGAAPVAMLSYQAWQRDYAGDPSVIGSSFSMNTHPVTIIGVTPQAFYGDRLAETPPDFYLPISQEPILGFYSARNKANLGWLFLVGRVMPGVAIGSLQEKMTGLLRQSLGELEGFQTVQGRELLARAHVVLTPGGQGVANMQHRAQSSLYLLMGLAGMVLLIACANIANLMLVRGIARRVETSVRMALGAARARIVRQMLTESLVLACLGGAAGLLLAYAGTKLLLGLMFTQATVMPVDATPSLPVIGFAFAASLLTGLIFGAAPAWISSKEHPANAMRGANRSTRDRSSLLQRSLVILQAALSVVLLIGAGLLGKSLNKLQHQNLGLEAENRVIVDMNPLKAGYKPQQLQGLYQQIEDKFHAMPGVEHVGLTLYTPLNGDIWSFYSYVQGQRAPDPGQDAGTLFNRASPEYFKAVGQQVLRGRTFTAADTATAPGVAVVNQAFVQKLFKHGEDPLGKRFGVIDIKNSGDFEIVGVVENTKYQSARDQPDAMFFAPMLQPGHMSPSKDLDSSLYAGQFVLHLKAMTPGLEEQVRKTLASIDPNLAVDHYQTFENQIEANFSGERMIARLTLLFGVLALVLAAVGLYGVTAYSVQRRTQEIGIRMALGSSRGIVVGNVLRGAMLQTAVGLVIGIPAALFCVRSIKSVQSQLFEVVGGDAGVIAAAVCTLAVAACIAGIIPARRAASIDPAKALRTE